ncbi:hypothetical protein CAAN1_10S02630 [[Candida] anglica]|uniref:Uncharacterized protein n=1 Tax=[Candida] anglica TaxID=148631 RepID=A0ABP0EI20_9ASCO
MTEDINLKFKQLRIHSPSSTKTSPVTPSPKQLKRRSFSNMFQPPMKRMRRNDDVATLTSLDVNDNINTNVLVDSPKFPFSDPFGDPENTHPLSRFESIHSYQYSPTFSSYFTSVPRATELKESQSPFIPDCHPPNPPSKEDDQILEQIEKYTSRSNKTHEKDEILPKTPNILLPPPRLNRRKSFKRLFPRKKKEVEKSPPNPVVHTIRHFFKRSSPKVDHSNEIDRDTIQLRTKLELEEIQVPKKKVTNKSDPIENETNDKITKNNQNINTINYLERSNYPSDHFLGMGDQGSNEDLQGALLYITHLQDKPGSSRPSTSLFNKSNRFSKLLLKFNPPQSSSSDL